MHAQSQPRAASTSRVFRNTSLLVGAQVITTPVSILINAIAGRTLGSGGFGLLYQALTFSSFIFLFVEWGQANVLTGWVARERAQAGVLLGSGIAFRVCAALIALILLPVVCVLSGYSLEFLIVLELAMLLATFVTVSAACQDVLRGFERMDFAAASFVGWQLLNAAVVIPTLLLGGSIRALLIAQVFCAALGTGFVLRMLPRMKVPHLSIRRDVVLELLRAGRPFIVFGLVLLLQPAVDAAMLSKFAPADSIGWYAAARKLVGVLIFPATALVAASYPTLCRLYHQDLGAYRKTAADALFAVSVFVLPVALGCGLFPELGVAIYGQQNFAPAATDLRVLAPYVFMVYFSMVVGSCLVSAGRQNAWTAVQLGSVVVSTALDPLLISWFQAHYGNGGLGVCTATVISEVFMISGGLWLLPKGILSQVPRGNLGHIWSLVRRRG